MGATLNEKMLEEKLAAIEKARAWSPRVIAKLEALVASGDDLALFRVNPIKFGTDKGLAEAEAIDLFLHAAKVGLFQMDWQLLCPGCGEAVESFGSLQALHSEYYCTTCQMAAEASLDDYIQISFTVSPQIRPIRYHEPDTLPVEDYYFNYVFTRDSHFGGAGAAGVFKSLTCGLAALAPGETKTIEITVAPETLAISDHKTRGACGFSVAGPPATGVQKAAVKILDGKMESFPPTLAPGTVALEVENLSGRRAALLLLVFPTGMVKAPVQFLPFLSGKKLLTTQTFRDLFRSEVIKGTESLSVKSITLLFTDLKGSTALYDHIGDLKAFALVQQHFESLGRIVQKHAGAIVKTIGDAVMATFLDPVSGVTAALEMLEDIESFNREHGTRELILKIGLHHGPSLAVTSNDRLDYFGQTVNVASRVQGLADAEEIYLTREVHDFPGVKALLDGLAVTSRKAALRGIQSHVEVFRLAPRAAAAGAAR